MDPNANPSRTPVPVPRKWVAAVPTMPDTSTRHATIDEMIRLMEETLHQLIGRLSHCLQGFMHPRWCRISSINSTSVRQQKIHEHLKITWNPNDPTRLQRTDLLLGLCFTDPLHRGHSEDETHVESSHTQSPCLNGPK